MSKTIKCYTYNKPSKVCPSCKIDKAVSEFYKCKRYGIKSYCKICECEKKKPKRSSQEYRDKIKDRRKNDSEFAERMRMLSKESAKRNYNPEKAKEYRIKYRSENYEKCIKYSRDYSNRNKNNPLYKLARACKSRLHDVLRNKRMKKTCKTREALGCDYDKLKEHLESLFTEGMSWDNFGLHGWHIDHIIPLNSAKTEEEVYELSHYTNLQPLWAIDNIRKKDKLPERPVAGFKKVYNG